MATLVLRSNPRDRGGILVRGGFTLVELCVVIAIIVLLVAISLPMLGAGRAAAVRAEIDNDLRQQYTAIMEYAGDHDQLLPGPSNAALSCLLTSFQILPVYPGARPLDGYLASYLTFTLQPGGMYLCNAAYVKQGKAMASYYFRVGVPSLSVDPYSGAFGNASGKIPVKLPQLSGIYGLPLTQFVLLQTTDTRDPFSPTAVAYPLDPQGRHYLYADGHIELRGYNNPPPKFQSTLTTP